MALPAAIKEAELRARLDTAIGLGNALSAAVVSGPLDPPGNKEKARREWKEFVKTNQEVPVA